jgi:hypothetical protein
MHAALSGPRGSPFDANTIDAIHVLLQLQPGKALLNQAHLVCRGWDPDLDGSIKRILAASPKINAYTQVFARYVPSNSAQFLTALDKPAECSLLLFERSVQTCARYLPGQTGTGAWALAEMIRGILHFLSRRQKLPTSTGSLGRVCGTVRSYLWQADQHGLFDFWSRTLVQIFTKKVPGTDRTSSG